MATVEQSYVIVLGISAADRNLLFSGVAAEVGVFDRNI